MTQWTNDHRLTTNDLQNETFLEHSFWDIACDADGGAG